MRHVPRSTWMIALLVVGVMLACRSPFLPPHDTTPGDTSAKQLDLLFNVNVAVDAHGVPQVLKVIASFTYQNVDVTFQHGEQIVCDGVVLNSDSGATVPLPKDGGPVVCDYEQGTAKTEFSFVPPLNLIVSSPLPNAKLPRSSKTTIAFTPDAGSDVLDINMNCEDVTVANQDSQEIVTKNAASILCNSSTFKPGVGTIHVNRDYELHPRVGFHSMDLILTIAATIPVQWT